MREFLYGGEYLPIYLVFLRTAFLYVALIIATRIMNHRQVGILSGHNYLVAAGIVSLAAVRMVNPKSSFLDGFLIIFVYALTNYFWSWLDIQKPIWVDRQPLKVIENGDILANNLAKANVPIDNLLAQLRLQKVGSIKTIAKATLEPMGKISIINNAQESPVTKGQMKVWPKETYLPNILIYEGIVLSQNLKLAGLNMEWLNKQIKEQKIIDLKQIFIAILDSSGQLYLQLKGDENNV